jgi:DNA-binding MarR family transcriptional regulator
MPIIGMTDEIHPDLPPSMRERVPFLLYRTAAASHGMANSMLGELGLSARQVGILTLVTERAPMTQKELGVELQIDRTVMVDLIDQLESKGLVRRLRNPRDRRAFLIQPTPAGRKAKEAAVAVLDRQQKIFLEPLAAEERRHLAGMLNRLFAAARARQEEGTPEG